MKFINFIFFIIPFFVYTQNDSLTVSIKNGKSLYEDFCLRCHMPDGQGQIGIIHQLAIYDFLFKHMEESIKAI